MTEAKYKRYLTHAERLAIEEIDERLHALRKQVVKLVRRRTKMVKAAHARRARDLMKQRGKNR